PVQCSRVLRTRCALPMPPDPVGQDERFRARPPRSRRLRARHGACLSPRMNHALGFEALAAAYPDRACNVTPTRRLSYSQVADELCYLFDDADAVAVVYHARYAPTLARIRGRLPKLRLLLQVDDGSGELLLPGALDYAAALAAATPAGPPVRPTPDDLYIIY